VNDHPRLGYCDVNLTHNNALRRLLFPTVDIIITTATDRIFSDNAVDYQNMTTISHGIFLVGAILLAE